MISVNLGVWFTGMQRSMVKLSQTTRKCTVIMLLCYYHLVLFFMNMNLKGGPSGYQNSYDFSLKETLKEQILQFSFAPFLWTKCINSSTIGNFQNSYVFPSLFLSTTGNSSRQAWTWKSLHSKNVFVLLLLLCTWASALLAQTRRNK